MGQFEEAVEALRNHIASENINAEITTVGDNQVTLQGGSSGQTLEITCDDQDHYRLKEDLKHRKVDKAFNTRSKVPEAKRSTTAESAEGKLSVVRPSERRCRALQKWAKKGVFLVEPQDNGRPLVVTVTELTSLTVKQAKLYPDKVRAVIQKTLDKIVETAPAKRPTMPLMPRPVCDARRSVPFDPPSGILTKPTGEARLEGLAVTETIESSSP